MPVQAGESTAEAPVVQNVDANALASNIVAGVFQTLERQGVLANSGNTKQERQSAFKAKANELLESGKVDKDVMPIMLELIEAMGSDMTSVQREEAMKAARDANIRNIHGEIDRMIDRYAQTATNPELIRKLNPSIKKDAIDEFNSNPAAVAAFERDGSVDWKLIDNTIVREVKKWGATAGGEKESKPAGGIAMKNSAPSGVTEPSSGLSVDEILNDERKREIYNSQVSFAVKNMQMSREDANKRALDLINKAEEKVKQSKHKR